MDRFISFSQIALVMLCCFFNCLRADPQEDLIEELRRQEKALEQKRWEEKLRINQLNNERWNKQREEEERNRDRRRI